jgi:hypothetical protein
MKQETFWRNPALQMAGLAGLAVAIAAYMILSTNLSIGVSAKPKERQKQTTKAGRQQTSAQSLGNLADNKTRVLAAIRIADYEILRPRLKKGVRVNILCGYEGSQGLSQPGKTILENVLVVEVPGSSNSRLSPNEQGVLIEISRGEADQLVSQASAEPLRVLIGGSVQE